MSTEDTPKPAAWLMVNTANPRLTPSVTLTPHTGWHITWEARPLFDQATIDAAVTEESERCAKVAEGAQQLPNAGDDFANGWCSAALQIAQAIRRA